MTMRVVLRSPFTEPVVRDVVDGIWKEASGEADEVMGRDHWALPGLVDAHAHLASDALFQPGDFESALERARQALAAGVTLVLDKGWCDDTTIRVISTLDPSERPDIEAARRLITVPEGYYPDFGLEIDPGEIEAAVAEEAAAGAGWVKLVGDWPRRGRGPVANFTEEELGQAVAAAEAAGARVAIHTMAPEVPSLAVAAGVHSIEHGLFLTEDDIASLGERGGMWVPTILRVEETIVQLGGRSSGGQLLSEGLSNVRRLLPLAAESGVAVLAGTDLVGSPANVASEAVKLGEYGLSARQMVAAVSVSGLSATGRSDAFGVGSTADAVLFEANPVEEPGVLAHPSFVIRSGRLVA
ncbi:MAG TPA: hypothetical protein EYP73_03725 [Acidimicrobiia bacterium]|nr:hypothetical protein [Acidimicrobiia bacterium]